MKGGRVNGEVHNLDNSLLIWLQHPFPLTSCVFKHGRN